MSDETKQPSNNDPRNGCVALVGAGPGDPGLITVRGAKLLELADVVVYDALANPRLLGYCPRAKIIYAGKRGADHAMSQSDISGLLVRLGTEGNRVVRLKGGDPFVFGRGGEEAEALAQAAVRFEVVPGITAAIAAAAYAGIPVTHRDLNSSFTLITGHEKEQSYKDPRAVDRGQAEGSSDIDWPSLAKLPCVAFYMGVKSLARICAKLIEHGMPPTTPAATIQWGTLPKQRTIAATIATLADAVETAGVGSPAITIVGRVVAMRDTLNWFETRPLFGKTILVTRTRQQASELTAKLEDLGATVLEAPTIETVEPESWLRVDAALRSLAGDKPDWLIFTSANGVTAARDRLLKLDLDARVFAGVKIAAIGGATSAALLEHFAIRADLCPDRALAESLSDALFERNEIAGKRFVCLRADIARPVLVERLHALRAKSVEDIAVYETRRAAGLPIEVVESLRTGRVDWVTFTSGSTVKNLVQLLESADPLKATKIASIGPVTSEAVRAAGLTVMIEAKTADIASLVDAVVQETL